MKNVLKRWFMVALCACVILALPQNVEATNKKCVKSLKVEKNVTVEVGKKVTVQPTVIVSKKASKKVTVKSKDKKIAKVRYNSKKNDITIKGVHAGKTTIVVSTKAKDGNGKKISKKIEVEVKSAKKEKTESTTEKSTETVTEKSTESTTEQTPVEDETPTDISGDGWYLSNNTLRLSKIYYSICNIAGNNYYVYDTPWNDYKNQIISLEIDADMVYKDNLDTSGEDSVETSLGNASVIGENLLFGGMDSLKCVTITRLNLDKITDISYMFANNINLTQLDVSGLDISKVQNVSNMFAGNISLCSIDFQNLDTSSLITVSGMFKDCTSLSSVSVSSWNTSNIKDFSHVFENCKSLTSINLSGWTIDDADVTAMFDDCEALVDVQLTNVSLENTIAVNSMFNENNSITSYKFAEEWNIYTEKDKCIFPIIDNCYYAIPILNFSGNSSIIIEYVYYKKIMPTWYKKSVEFEQSIDEFDKIFSSSCMDVYISVKQEEDAEPPTLTDVVDSVCNALAEINPETEEETGLLNNVIKKLDLIKKVKDREFDDEDLKELFPLELDFAEIEDLVAEE